MVVVLREETIHTAVSIERAHVVTVTFLTRKTMRIGEIGERCIAKGLCSTRIIHGINRCVTESDVCLYRIV